MVEIIVKYGRTFKKGKDYHRIDLTMRKELGDVSIDKIEGNFYEGFLILKGEVKELKEDILKDARI